MDAAAPFLSSRRVNHHHHHHPLSLSLSILRGGGDVTDTHTAAYDDNNNDDNDTTNNDYSQRIQKIHDDECQTGFGIFGTSDEFADVATTRSKSWTDNDFESATVGVGNAGPDEALLLEPHGSTIFWTKEAVIPVDECQALIDEAKQVIASGLVEAATATQQDQQRTLTNSELNEARVSTLPKGKIWLQRLLHSKLFPLLESRFGVDAKDLTLNDALIIGYKTKSQSQPIHRDASIVSLNIALSPRSDYQGGGTYFEGFDINMEGEGRDNPSSTLQIDQGHVMCHSSGALHAGKGIDEGERWILVLFVLDKSKPQVARRCHDLGSRALARSPQDGPSAVSEAQQYFETGLEDAPNDHLLRSSLATMAIQQQQQQQGNTNTTNTSSQTRQHLLVAQSSYPLCPKACMTHGHWLVRKRRPRAALRRFEMALQRLEAKPDLQSWTPLLAIQWDALIQAGRCACLCAEFSSARWRRLNLPLAIQRLEKALRAAPDHPPLVALLGVAQEILQEVS
jgi:hypothetical protein